jgi:chromatin assembly factor 1 subunit B
MKAETPQILWHNGKDNEQNKNAPIYSISVLESGLAEDGVVQSSEFGLVLATAGNTEVNLWKLRLQSSDDPALYSKLDRSTPYRMVNSQLLTTLSRHDATVNCIAFSPNGLHLATASDSGTVIIYSIPPSKRGNGNGRHFWSTLGDSTIENSSSQLSMKIISGHDGIYDLDWSPDSKRFMVGTLDHSIAIYEDENYNANLCQPLHKDSQWKCIYRNSRDHSHYVQGVAMDPLNYYAASMSCDRTVRVFGRKSVKTKSMRTTVALTQNRLELGKGKLIKYRTLESTEPPDSDAPKQRQALFAEEAASESFFRRLSWTTDGSYLVTPAVLWGDDMATCLFRRHAFDQPARVLLGHDKVRCRGKFLKTCDSAASHSRFSSRREWWLPILFCTVFPTM